MEKTADIAGRLLYLGFMAMAIWGLWAQIPDHKRAAVRLALWARAREVSQRAARATARAAMHSELDGAGQAYHLPYWLSRARDAAAAGYERSRGLA